MTHQVRDRDAQIDLPPTCGFRGTVSEPLERCGAELDFEDCWSCGGEGGEFLDDLFPLEYEPGTWEDCEECGGRGTISYCPEARRHAS